MRKFLLAATSAMLLLFSPQLIFKTNGQIASTKQLPSDNSLKALAEKYVHTPIKKIITPEGDVFLQRDMSVYLHANVSRAPEVSRGEQDHGHDHKDAMLRTFLNRPHPDVATLNRCFNSAAAEFNVPASILKASAQVQSNWAQVSESIYGSWGVMGLVENKFIKQVTLAASLLHLSPAAIQNDAKTNIRAAAALLSYYQKDKPASVKAEDWFEAVTSLTGLRDPAMKKDLALRIFDVMKTGSKTVTLWGEIILIEPLNVSLPKLISEPDLSSTATTPQATAAVDYPNAVPYFTTCNFNNRPAGSAVKYYFVHYVATGTYQGAISWFKDCSSEVSAHYVIRNNDGEVSQVVAENDRAWSQGVSSYNDLGIGVEHEVLATNLSMWDSEPMLASAASLCMNVCTRRAIPRVRRVNNGDAGIYGHSDVRATECPNLTQARWTNYLARINAVSVAPPLLFSIENPGSGTQVRASWRANLEPTLAGYRLYYANSDALDAWSLAADESTLTASTTSVTLDASQFVVPPSGNVYHFKLTAVVTDGTNPVVESAAGDIYSRSSNTSGPKVLIVDGFDRTNGSYTNASHSFVASYLKSLRDKTPLQISSVANEKVEDGTLVLTNYDIVIWFVGDESSANVVFSTNEKSAITSFLTNGGKLIVSGSEIAYNVSRPASATYDAGFANNYLKSAYVNDGASTYTPATGITGTAFEGLHIPFGVTYPEDFPDAISPVNGSISILNYNISPNRAGVAYKGIFGAGTKPGALAFLSFPLETAADTAMAAFMGKALDYFYAPVIPIAIADVATTQTAAAKRVNVLANDNDNGVAIDPLTLAITVSPAHGTATADQNGNVTYTSNAGFTGTDAYQYTVKNISGQVSNSATVSVTVEEATACNPASPEVDDLYPKRDLRGAWVSTVSNIDWPSSRTLSTDQQQAQLIRILDTLSATGINTVYLQVRPESDALYASSIDPWSYWLTNAQGTAPNPFWDPLAFAITAAHARGMQLHAWLNPYRAKQSTPVLAANHVARLHPDWTFVAGTLTMLNPGLPQVRTYLTEVIADIANRYNVDGIHFDDYFYPSTGFTRQDSVTYIENNPTGIATIEDWRRNNVNMLIARIYDTLAVINSAGNRNILFGVSPFGIWKSGTPAGITGNSSYSAMYCDPIAWLQAGKVDYLAPQLYWRITGPQDYNALSKWWNDQSVTYNRHIYPGLALYKMSDANNWAATEIENQVSLNRDQVREQVKGQVLFSTQHIMNNIKGIRTALQSNQFRYPSFAPAMPWKDSVCPNTPISVRRDGDTIRWNTPAPAADGDLPVKYVVYRFENIAEAATHFNDGKKVYAIVTGNKLGLAAADVPGNSYFMVTSLDKNNNESDGGMSGIVLPVTGLTLNVTLSGNAATVNWVTLTEINTMNFEVERSTDGRTFARVATVTAAGTSNRERRYAVQDLLPSAGIYYYRVKSIDRDGRSNYSPVQHVLYQFALDNIVIGPNPFRSWINISNLQQVSRLDLIDISGRVMLSKMLNNQQSFRLEATGLPAGVYYLRVTKTNGERFFRKVVKG